MMAALTALTRRVGWLYALVLCGLWLRYLWHNAFLVPTQDEWGMTHPLVIAAFDGRLNWQDVFAPYNGHRIVIPRIITLLGAVLTRWDVRFGLVINTLLIAGCILLVLATFHRSRLLERKGFTAALLIALLITPIQFINQVYGFQICIMLMMLSLYAFAWALVGRAPSRRIWVIGAVAAFTASWSFLAGNLLWALVPIGMWLAGERHRRAYALWLLWAAVNLVVHFLWGYQIPAEISEPFVRPALPAFLLSYLGGIFSSHLDPLQALVLQNPDQAQIVGAIGMALLALTLGLASRGLSLKQAAPWLMLIGFALGAGGLLYLGRPLSLYLVMSSRYTTLAVPFWIGLLGLWMTVVGAPAVREKWRLIVLNAGLLAAPLLLALFALTAYRFYAYDLERDTSNVCLLVPDSAPNCPDRLLRIPRGAEDDRTEVIARIEALRQRRLSLYGARYLPDLRDVPLRQPTAVGDASWQVQRIDDVIYPVLFMRPPTQVEQRVYVPDTFERVSLQTAVYVPPPETIPENGDRAQADGAGFAIWIIAEDGVETLGSAGIYVPGADDAPIPVTIDLTPYRGQRVTIRYGTEPRAHPDYDWAMWVEPRLVGE